jgi:biopolymer transport protein ExbB
MIMLARHFEEGGRGMYPILVCSIAMMAAALVSLTRLWARRPNAERLVAGVEHALALGDVDAAVMLAADPRAPAERIALAGLRESLQPAPRIEAALACALLAELPRLRTGHRVLVTTTQVATLFGLLGTVGGIALGFGFAHGPWDAASRAQALARGIGEAMNCTAFGLLVSTCSLFFAFVVDARAEMLRRELELVGRAVANSLAAHRAQLRWLGARAPMERPTYRSAA